MTGILLVLFSHFTEEEIGTEIFLKAKATWLANSRDGDLNHPDY